jgi:hypothetical protein
VPPSSSACRGYLRSKSQILACDSGDFAQLHQYIYEEHGFRHESIANAKREILEEIAKITQERLRHQKAEIAAGTLKKRQQKGRTGIK